MQIVRVILQIVILLVGGIGLVVLLHAEESPSYLNIVLFVGFVAFLLALTMFLKEQTESRIYQNLSISSRPFGVAMFLLGAFGVFHGAGYFIGTESVPNGSGYCRAICGLVLLVTESFGELAGHVVAGFLWSAIGIMLCFFGFKVAR